MKPPKQKKLQQSKEKQTHLQNPHEPTNTIIKDLLWFSLIATFFKLLLIPAYHSTDFEVHRNWLALTHTLPLSQWYTDETSPWTLDYPPFFAYFEYLLSHFASLVDPTITDLYNGLNYKSPSVIIFQRLTKRLLIWISVISSPGLLIVDHIHFQYNGFLLGLLMASLGALQNGHDLTGGFIFAILLCFKHLFAVAGPVYFVYILRHYCRGGFLRGFSKLITMGVVVIAVFVAAYGPFAYHGQIQDVLKRFYIKTPTASFTGGLVGDSSPFAILPTVTPLVTFGVVLLAILPCVFKIWRNPDPKKIVRWVAYAYTCGFLFGWHVHEKASLHFLIPLAVVAVESIQDAQHYFMLSIVSIYSLFPLLYEAQEYPVKVILLLLYVAIMWFGFSSTFSEKKDGVVSGWIEKSYMVGFVVVEIWGQFLHPLILGDRFPFLPLMLISFYCALGMMYSWIWQLKSIIRSH
ncbi:unnamed protein product [Lactuca virosa]|uniref:Alpha-1,3-glucosyltransferase n=1 Tax=Lactuca virosa TaxID=75947 RepID=A0AAU9LIA1_9ASTR|nr:unnamed protein product [Lactuca virosa]